MSFMYQAGETDLRNRSLWSNRSNTIQQNGKKDLSMIANDVLCEMNLV